MSEREFLRRWDGSLEALVSLHLQSTQQESAVLVPLARFPKASLLLIDHAAASSLSNHRCTAAALAGLLGSAAPPDLLERLFDAECARLGNGQDPFTITTTQSAVEALVFAAARWCRDERSREAGLALCRKVVERTIEHANGEYWGAAPYALVTMVRHLAPDADALLARFAGWAEGPPPEFLTKPTLQNERACARALAANVPSAVGRVDALLDKIDAMPPFEFAEAARVFVDEWLELAKEIG